MGCVHMRCLLWDACTCAVCAHLRAIRLPSRRACESLGTVQIGISPHKMLQLQMDLFSPSQRRIGACCARFKRPKTERVVEGSDARAGTSPASAKRRAQLEAIFAWIDANGDGQLSAAEVI